MKTIDSKDLRVFLNVLKNYSIISDLNDNTYKALKTVILTSCWLSDNGNKVYTNDCKIKNTTVYNIVNFIDHLDDYINALYTLNEYAIKDNELRIYDKEENQKLLKTTTDMIDIYEHEHDKLIESL